MKNASRRINSIKIFVIAITFVVAIIGFFSFSTDYKKVRASSSGPTPSHTNAPGEGNCTACHGDFPINTGSGNILIQGVTSTYSPNQQMSITVTVNQSDAVIYGFQLTAINFQGQEAGTFSLPNQTPAQTQIVEGLVNGNTRRYVQHTSQGTIPSQFGTKSWTFTWTAPSQTVGNITFYAAGNAANSDGDITGDRIYSTAATTSSNTLSRPTFDFDGDGKTDIGIFRPSLGEWWYQRSSNNATVALQFGSSSDTPTPADFTGDGKTDIAFWRPASGTWFVLRSEDNSFFAFPFGSSGDIPAPGDFDGDGKADAAVFRPSNSVWYIFRSSDSGVTAIPFGIAEDKPVVADYDGDGKSDIAIYRPSNSQWWRINSSNSSVSAVQFGSSGDKTVPGDYTGDGKADVAFWRASTGEWFVLRSEDNSFFAFPWGSVGDIAVAGDYDGDGRTDASVFRPSNSVWYLNRTTSGVAIIPFGLSTDTPIPSVFNRP